MELRRWGRQSRSERLLRTARPTAPDKLVQRLAMEARPMRRTGAPRLVAAGFASAIMLVGLAAVGGVSRAATEVAHIASVATGHTNNFGARLALSVNTTNAANAQYGGQTVSSQTQSSTAGPGSAGTIAVTPSRNAKMSVAVSWSTTTFGKPVSIHLDPAPPSVTSSALVGSGNSIVSIIVTDSSGNIVHTLSAPIAIRFANPPKNFRPVISDDGTSYQALPLLPNKTLDDLTSDNFEGGKAGYYYDTNGDVVILTTHLTLFAVLYSANVNVSESGKKTPAAGSGKFGDPTRNHTGAPVLKQVGSKITPAVGAKGAERIPFSFTVDEQAAVYMTIYNAKGNPVWIDKSGTTIRGQAYTGAPVHTLHLVILRPGQINTKIKVPAGTLTPGQKYKIRITAIDFDGHKVTEYTTFTA